MSFQNLHVGKLICEINTINSFTHTIINHASVIIWHHGPKSQKSSRLITNIIFRKT